MTAVRVPATRRRARTTLVLIAFAVAFAALRVNAYRQMSATWDEPIHLTAGYAALTRGDFRVDPSHPPFAREWAALPLLAMRGISFDARALDTASAEWWLADDAPYRLARQFMYRDNDADRMLYAARFMVVLLGVGAGVLLFCWCHEWLGFRAAVIGLGFYLLTPTIAAHTSLVTTDAAEMTFFFGAAYCLWRLVRRDTGWNLAALAVCLSLAIVSKYSGLVLVPIVGVMLIGCAVRGLLSPRRALRHAAVLAAACVFVIWAVYGFRSAPSSDPAWRFTLTRFEDVRRMAPTFSGIIALVEWSHLLPNAFTEGLLYCAVAEGNPSYLLGRISANGWWYYFPIAFLVKTPIILLALSAAGCALFIRARQSLGTFNELLVIVPVMAYLAVAVASGINIGVRHILPIYPFVLLVSTVAATRLLAWGGWRGPGVLAAAVMVWASSVARAYPHSLSFFNALAGGPQRGVRYLADSNLDWGQDLKRLRQWMDGHGVDRINLAYFGQADRAYYGIRGARLPGTAYAHLSAPELPGLVAISATLSTGLYLPPGWRVFYGELQTQRPVAMIGNTIRVYRVDKWPEAATPLVTTSPDSTVMAELDLAARLAALGWSQHALVHFQRFLHARPNDARGRAGFGMALVQAGEQRAGEAALRQALALAPHDDALRQLVAGGQR